MTGMIAELNAKRTAPTGAAPFAMVKTTTKI